MRSYLAVAGVSVVLACGGGGDATAPKVPLRLDVVNYLYRAVTVSVDGVPYGGVGGGTISGPSVASLTLPAGARTLTYTVTPWTYNDGSPIPHDFSGESLALPSSDASLSINNFAGAQPYFAFYLTNASGVSVDVAVATAAGVRCLATLGNTSAWFGYYALTASSEVRTYRGGTSCAGTYRYWTTAQLQAYNVNSGVLLLSTTIAP